jgi:hypothetical protein
MFALSLCLLPSCQTVKTPNARACTVAGVFQAGMDCAESNTGKISELDFEQMIEFLEPQPERVDRATGKTLPPRAGAVCHSDDDFTKLKVALEQACVILRKRCTPEMREALVRTNATMRALRAQAKRSPR